MRFDNGGGLPNIRRHLEKAAESAEALARLRLRTWVVFDSDALAPERPSRQAQELDSICEKSQIQRHRLKRRAMENYIPAHELHDYWQRRGPMERKKAAGAFLRLAPVQRHHYCMWSGFAGDEGRPNKGDTATRAEVDALFSMPPVSEEDRARLAGGFGEDIAEIFAPDEARGRLAIAEERLRLDGQAEEMEPLFRDILRWV